MFRRAPSIPDADQPGGMWSQMRAFRDTPIEIFTRAHRQEEPLVRFHLGPLSVLGVFDPDLIEEVLVKQPDVFVKQTRGQRLLRVLLGDSMLTTEGNVWKARRRLGQPHFKRTVLERYRPVMQSASDELALRWQASSGQTVDVGDEMMGVTLRIACEALFGGDLGRASAEVHEALSEVLDAYMAMVTMPIPSPERLPLPVSFQFYRARRRLFAVVDDVIARRRAAPAAEDLLGDWLAAGLPDEDLRSEVVTMLLAAHETTANLLTWTLALLSQHPGIRRTLVTELEARDPAIPLDLRQQPWLYGVLMETLRLRPPVWMLSRSTTRPVQLGAHQLAANTYVFVSPYTMHRDPRYWDNPEGFDPERWHVGRPAHKMAFLPFGAGQRRCIGEQFALLEAAVVLAAVLPRVSADLIGGHDLQAKPSVTLRPDGPVPMTIRTR